MILTQLVLSLSVVCNFLSIVIVVLFVLPRVVEEARINDGLWLIRKGFLVIIIFYLIATVLSFLSFVVNPKEVNDIIRLVRFSVYFNSLSLLNSLGKLSIALLLALIYRWNYKEPFH